MKFPKDGEVVSEDERGNKTIKATDGYYFIAIHGSLNQTESVVGTKGKILWVKGASFSLPFFIDEKK